MKIKFTNWSIIASTLFLIFSCTEPEKETPKPVTGSVYVVNEGNFGSGNGYISVYNAITKETSLNPFRTKNLRDFGDVLQSLTFIDTLGYAVINNGNKIQIFGQKSFSDLGIIENLKLPRYIIKVSEREAYVSEYVSFGEDGRISIVDLVTKSITGTINLGLYPENMVKVGNKVFVCNSGGNTVSVINTINHTFETNITTNDQPSNLVFDGSSTVWVICKGKKVWLPDYSGFDSTKSTLATIAKINVNNLSYENKFIFGSTTQAPSNLDVFNGKLYYINSGANVLDINSTTFNPAKITSRSLYGLNVDPNSGDLYLGTLGFVSSQKLLRYNANLELIDSSTVGIGPNGFVFKN